MWGQWPAFCLVFVSLQLLIFFVLYDMGMLLGFFFSEGLNISGTLKKWAMNTIILKY